MYHLRLDSLQCLELPTEELLARGSDSRSIVLENGLTRYGTSPGIRDAAAFGSCTASSPDGHVYGNALSLHAQLRNASDMNELDLMVRNTYRSFRSRLLTYLNVQPTKKIEVAFCPSGTDAEYLALLLALRERTCPIFNIVVAPQEVGSGSLLAASGLHFDSITPHGQSDGSGSPVTRTIANLVESCSVDLRDGRGEVRSTEDLDAEVEAIVSSAINRKQKVLLHIVCHSKTGSYAPSMATAMNLRDRYGERLTLVVDAAQGRGDRTFLETAFTNRMMVIFTGSKFYGAPPFSGALLVPEELSPRNHHMPPIPPEFSSYFSRGEFPETWAHFSSQLQYHFNLGLLIRWGAALESMRAFYGIPDVDRHIILDYFTKTLCREFEKHPALELVIAETPHNGGDIGNQVTVFPFRVRCCSTRPGHSYLRSDDLKLVAGLLNQDITRVSSDVSENSFKLRAKKYQIGQPVYEEDERQPALLRYAIGAALVSKAYSGGFDSRSLETELDWYQEQVGGMLGKTSWIASNIEMLNLGQSTIASK